MSKIDSFDETEWGKLQISCALKNGHGTANDNKFFQIVNSNYDLELLIAKQIIEWCSAYTPKKMKFATQRFQYDILSSKTIHVGAWIYGKSPQ